MGVLTNLTIILLLGIIISNLASALRVPDVLLLLILGLALGSFGASYSVPLTDFPPLFLNAMSILALAMIIFDATTRMRLKEFDTFSFQALKLVLVFLVLSILLFSPFMHYLANIPLSLCVLFATIMVGTDPMIMFTSKVKFKAAELLRIEGLINTPFTVIIPLLLIDLMSNETSLFASLASHFGDLLGQFVTGIGSGIFIGIILLKILKRPFSGLYSPMAVFVAVLTAFALAENLKGSGVLAVTSLGLFFGNTAVRQKVLLLEFESVLAKSLYILVFVLLGSLLLIPWSLQFFMISIVLFLAHLFVRFLALTFIVKKMEYSFSEKIFLTLMNPKGISVAIVSFVLLLSSLSVLKSLLDFVLIFMLYSIIFASLASWTAPWLVEDLRKKRGTLND